MSLFQHLRIPAEQVASECIRFVSSSSHHGLAAHQPHGSSSALLAGRGQHHLTFEKGLFWSVRFWSSLCSYGVAPSCKQHRQAGVEAVSNTHSTAHEDSQSFA